MFGHSNNNQLPYYCYYPYDISRHLPSQSPLPGTTTTFPSLLPCLPPLMIPGDHDSGSCSSYGGSPSSITSYGALYNSPSFIPSSSISRVPSTGDLLQGVNLAQHNQRLSSSPMNESDIMESISRASPYSPEEKKERIERYRSKRNLRNFNKKIKYECRKTLADSRPRIRGRFARNDEIEKTPQSECDDDNHACMEGDYGSSDNWIDFLDPLSVNTMPYMS